MKDLVRGYSLGEALQMRRLVREPASLNRMARTIHKFRADVASHPDTSWDQLLLHHPSARKLEGRGLGILQNAVDINATSRKAASYWKERLARDPEQAVAEIREKLGIPDGIQIADMKFDSTTGIILMDDEQLQEYFKSQEEQEEAEEIYPVRGFTGSSLFLEDDTGNQCGIGIINTKDYEAVAPHEREHIFFHRYYLREPFVKETREGTVNRKNVIDAFVGELYKGNPEYGQFRFGLMRSIEWGNRGKKIDFYNEVIATSSGDDAFSKEDYFAFDVADYYDPTIVDAGPDHNYGEAVRADLEGYRQAIDRLPFTNTERLKLWFALEYQAQGMLYQNREVASWIAAVQRKTKKLKGGHGLFLGKLYAVPAGSPWHLGTFIGRDPEELQKRYQNLDHRRGEVIFSATERMMISYLDSNPHKMEPIVDEVRKYPEIAGHVDTGRRLVWKPDVYRDALFPILEEFHSTLWENGIPTHEDIIKKAAQKYAYKLSAQDSKKVDNAT